MDRDQGALSEARRKFLKSCGKYAIVTPPAVTLMLSAAASRSYAATHSGLRHKAVPGNASSDGTTHSSGAASSSDRGGDHDR